MNIRTPNTNISAGSISTNFIKDSEITPAKIKTQGFFSDATPEYTNSDTPVTTAGSFLVDGSGVAYAGSKHAGFYKIVSVGNTDFTAIGSANNNVNTVFKATGVGSGTGTAQEIRHRIMFLTLPVEPNPPIGAVPTEWKYGQINKWMIENDAIETNHIFAPNVGAGKVLLTKVTQGGSRWVDWDYVDTSGIADDAVTLAKLNTSGASNGQVLAYNSTSGAVEWSSNAVYSNASAISAIEGEATLDLTGKLTIDKATVPSSDVIFSSGAYNVADNSEMSVRSTSITPLTMVKQANLSGGWGQMMLMQRELNQSIAGLDNSNLQGTNISQAFSLADEVSAKYVGQHLVKITDVTVAGSAGSSYIDTFKGQYCLSVYNKTTGAVETHMNSLTSETAFTEVSNELRVVNKGDAGGATELSTLKLVYTGAQTGAPTGKIQLYQYDNTTTTDVMTLTTAKVDFDTAVEFNGAVEVDGTLQVDGVSVFNQSADFNMPVTVDHHLTVTGTTKYDITSPFKIEMATVDLTSPALHIEVEESNWNKAHILLEDSNDDAVSIVGRNNTASGQENYQLNFTLDPNNTKPRTNVGNASNQVYAGDYFFAFRKHYDDQDEVGMDMQVFGAHSGFSIVARDDSNGTNWSGDGLAYNHKPINLKGSEISLRTSPDGNSTTERVKVDGTRVTINTLTRFHNAASDPSNPLEGDVYYNTGSDRIKLYTGAGWKTLSVD